MSIIERIKNAFRRLRERFKRTKKQQKNTTEQQNKSSTYNLWQSIIKANSINLNEEQQQELIKKFAYSQNDDAIIANIPLNKLEKPDNYIFGVNKIINKDTKEVIKVQLGKLDKIKDNLDLVHELKRLNPSVSFELNKSSNEYKIISTELPENLNLPENFEYNFQNGITNRNNATSEILSEHLDLKPRTEINNYNDIYYELRRLNPTVEFQFQDPRLIKKLNPNLPINDYYLGVDKNLDMSKLNFPNEYYYNEKNGVTNKHKSESGLYLALDVIKLDYEKIKQNTPPTEKKEEQKTM